MNSVTKTEERDTALDVFMPRDPLQAIAWVGAITFAFSDPTIMEAFRKETGNRWTPSASPINKMIDKATGVERDFVMQFANWFNKNIWGPEE